MTLLHLNVHQLGQREASFIMLFDMLNFRRWHSSQTIIAKSKLFTK